MSATRDRGLGGASPKGGRPPVASSVETGFRSVQKKVLDELRRRTLPAKLPELELTDLAQILRTCNENLKSIHARKMSTVGTGKIEFVTKAPMAKPMGKDVQ